MDLAAVLGDVKPDRARVSGDRQQQKNDREIGGVGSPHREAEVDSIVGLLLYLLAGWPLSSRVNTFSLYTTFFFFVRKQLV